MRKLLLLVPLFCISTCLLAQPDGFTFERSIGKPLMSIGSSKIKIAANQYLYLLAGARVQKTTLKGDVLIQWGGVSTEGKGKFYSMKDLETDESSNVYVLDSKYIQKFDENGNFIKQWSVPSSYEFIYIQNGHIYVKESNKFIKYSYEGDVVANFTINFKSASNNFCVDKSENFYVSQTYEVSKYNSAGKPLMDYGTWTFSGPGQIGLDGEGNLYVEDNFNKKINVYAPSSMYHNRTIGASGYGPAYFQSIGSFTFDKDNNIFVSDNSSENSSIQKFLANGLFSRMFSLQDFQGNGYLRSPQHVAVDSEGSIYITDGNYIIQKFDPNGNYLREWGGKGTTDVTFGTISSISIDAQDRVVVCDASKNVLKLFDKNGQFIAKYNGYKDGKGYVFNSLISSDVDQNSRIYVNHYGTIMKYDPQGFFIKLFAGYGTKEGELNTPFKKMAIGGGFLYFLDANFINKFDTTGNFISRLVYSPGLSSILPIDSNQLLALSTDNYIIKYGEDGSFLKSWKIVAGYGDREFMGLTEMYKDKRGKLYFVDGVSSQVKIFTPKLLTSIEQSESKPNTLSVYPNPNNGTFTIAGGPKTTTTRIIDQWGRSEVHHSPQITTQLKGLVLVETEVEGRTLRTKLIIQ